MVGGGGGMNATMICFGGGGANQAKKKQKKEKIPYTKCSRAKAGNGGKRQSFVSETQFVIIYRPYMSGVGEGLPIRVYRQSERGKEHVFGQQK